MAVKHPTVDRAATAEREPVPNGPGAEAGKAWSTGGRRPPESLKQGKGVICAKEGEPDTEGGDGDTGDRNCTCPGDSGPGHYPQSRREGKCFGILFIRVSDGQTGFGNAVHYIKISDLA